MTRPTIAFINGSLRRKSLNGRLGRAIKARLADRLDFIDVGIGDLALYNEELDGDPPAPWKEFRAAIEGADGILFGSPEYNRSISGTLKNAIDVGSRPAGKNSWKGKRAALYCATPSRTGGVAGSLTLRHSCLALAMDVMAQPEAYWGSVTDEKVDMDGTINDPPLAKAVDRFAQGMGDWMLR